MQIIRASELGGNARKHISDIFVAGFMQWLKYFSKDEEKLSRAFAHMFVPEAFHVALIEGEIAGIAACTDGKTPPIHIKAGELRRHLGLIRGSIAATVLKKELENHPYPFPVEPGTGSIEFVATGPDHRGRGVASGIIRHILANEPYSSFILEVADTNETAVRVYEKLGFTEFFRVADKQSKQSGINHLVYMRWGEGRFLIEQKRR
ncbi:MAG TPA: GNAT family N-acetyltransferase [Feifaniaceae bacterium]|nr:GNAT family N-acetyltransferase [Feifaniaceae bacterium]